MKFRLRGHFPVFIVSIVWGIHDETSIIIPVSPINNFGSISYPRLVGLEPTTL
ncbi:MAG: hypothetical protein RMJ51_00655 [Candidatus Calescibacterium sp.]|nr:hypothetical protein [Candidatus Calescibacterium sp.]MCX7972659.1 hypothetical protein [bacterium]MDW8194744.1 hypothetical protein [Candidatus Calescibacterium sp.]